MALKLIATYSKRLGLPGYSSHQFSVCVETEISNIDDVAGESSRLYQRLQMSVDEEIQHTGFVPDQSYGISEQSSAGVFKHNGASSNGSNGHHSHGANGHSNGDVWKCSDKQRELILKLVEQHEIEKRDVEELSQEMFGATVKDLNKLQASGLIDRMLENYGGQKNSASRRISSPPRQRHYSNGGAR
jgi:hypothetical protein